MSVIFADVTDITIPEGSVTKIEETSGLKRVLWQKGLAIPKAHWEIVTFDDKNDFDYGQIDDFVDIGNGIEFFLRINTKPCRITYKADATLGDAYSLGNGIKLPADISSEISFSNYTATAAIDPISKVWCAIAHQYQTKGLYVSNVFTPTKWAELDTLSSEENLVHCCWSPKLNCFCILGLNSNDLGIDDYGSIFLSTYLLSLEGNVTASSIQNFRGTYPGFSHSMSSFFWSEKLERFVCHFRSTAAVEDMTSDSFSACVFLLDDGLKWEKKQIKISSDNEVANRAFHNICWMQSMNCFIAVLIRLRKILVFKSLDCINWEHIKEFDTSVTSSVNCAYSPEKQVLVVMSRLQTYITKDLNDWVEIPHPEDMPNFISPNIKWSKSLNSFVCTSTTVVRFSFGKLVIDN